MRFRFCFFDFIQCIHYFTMCYLQGTCYDDVRRQCDNLLCKLFPYLYFESTTESEQNNWLSLKFDLKAMLNFNFEVSCGSRFVVFWQVSSLFTINACFSVVTTQQLVPQQKHYNINFTQHYIKALRKHMGAFQYNYEHSCSLQPSLQKGSYRWVNAVQY